MDFRLLGEKIIKYAKTKGAHEAEVFITERIKNTIRIYKGDTESVKSSKEKGLGLRIFIDNKSGFGYSGDFSLTHLLSLADKTISIANETDSLIGNILPDEKNNYEEKLNIFDSELSTISLDEKIRKLKEAEKIGYIEDKRIINTEMALYEDIQKTDYIINSRGLNRSFSATEASMVFSLIASQDNSSETGWDFTLSRFYNKLDPLSSVKRAAKQAVSLLNGQKISSTKTTAVFSPYAAGEFLAAIAEALNAENCQKGRSFLKRSLGEEIASSNVTIIDDGTLSDGFLTVPMDGEGVPARRKTMIDRGILKTYLHNTFTASKEQIKSTGNGFRVSYKSLPGIAPSNFYLEKGDISESDLIKKIDKGIYLIQTLNVGGINTITGEYSVGANGIWIENGELTYPIREITIASFLPLMLKNIVRVADNLRFIPIGHSSVCGSPSFQIGEVTLGGK